MTSLPVVRAAASAACILAAMFTPPRVHAQNLRGTDAVLHAFDKHSIVLLGEIHWNAEEHRFIQKLLHDARLPGTVNDIAVEFGNSLYQPIIDRYTAGETVPHDSLQMVWRNTTQPLAWDRAIYEDVYTAVRDANRKLPPSDRLRVIALDPPIEWNSVHTAGDFPRIWGYRDPVWFTTLAKESLSKGRKVLVIAGGLHILRRDPPDFQPKSPDRFGLGDALAQHYAAQTFRIYPSVANGPVRKLIPDQPVGALVQVGGTVLDKQSSQLLWESDVVMFHKVNRKTVPFKLERKDFPPLGSLIDAIMYYRPSAAFAPLDVRQYRDSAYVAELRRRNQILLGVFGQDQSGLIDSLARSAKRMQH